MPSSDLSRAAAFTRLFGAIGERHVECVESHPHEGQHLANTEFMPCHAVPKAGGCVEDG